MDEGIDPLAPEAVGLGEAVGVVGAEVGVETEEGAEGCGLVVAEVGAGQVTVEVSGKDLGVRVRAEAGEGEAVSAAGVADLAGQEQIAEGIAERFAAVDADQPGRSQSRTPLEAEESHQFGVGDRGRVVEQTAREALGVWPSGA